MTGFLVSTAAVLLTAWITWAATYRAAYMAGVLDGRTRVQDHRCPKGDTYRIGCLECGSVATRVTVVPGGTKHNPLQGVQCNCAVPDPCYNGDTCCTSGNYDRPPYEALAERERQRDALLHVLRDDEIYGRNG